MPVTKISRKIVAIPDLIGSRVIVRRYIYRDKSGTTLLNPHISSIEKKCRIEQIQFAVSGSLFDFEEKDLKYFSDLECGTACQFRFSDTSSAWETLKNAIND